MKIAMIVSGVCCSDIGHNVMCVDKISEKIAKLKHGEVPLYELGLAGCFGIKKAPSKDVQVYQIKLEVADFSEVPEANENCSNWSRTCRNDGCL